MWWKLLLQAAVALGLDEWAKRKATELIKKGIDKLKKKAEDLNNAAPSPETASLVKEVAYLKYKME